MQQHRRRFKQTTSLEERLAEEARLREEAELLPHGPVRDAAIRRAPQAATGSHINQWVEDNTKLARLDEARRIIEEYAADLREIIKQLRRKMN